MCLPEEAKLSATVAHWLMYLSKLGIDKILQSDVLPFALQSLAPHNSPVSITRLTTYRLVRPPVLPFALQSLAPQGDYCVSNSLVYASALPR